MCDACLQMADVLQMVHTVLGYRYRTREAKSLARHLASQPNSPCAIVTRPHSRHPLALTRTSSLALTRAHCVIVTRAHCSSVRHPRSVCNQRMTTCKPPPSTARLHKLPGDYIPIISRTARSSHARLGIKGRELPKKTHPPEFKGQDLPPRQSTIVQTPFIH